MFADENSAAPRAFWPFALVALGMLGIFLGATLALLAMGGGR